jgi:cell division protein FtsZ
VFACVEATGPARAREVVEKLVAHPLLDEGRALAESSAVLVSLMGGKELAMAEVNRVMEQIGRQCEHAQIIMGAAVDETLKNRLSVTVIAAKPGPVPMELPPLAASGDSVEQVTARGIVSRPGPRCASSSLTPEQREQSVAKNAGTRARKSNPKMRQAQLSLAIISKGRFDKSEPTIHKGEDLDIPTYVRRGVALN